MPTTAKQLLEAANAAVPKISGKEAQEMVAKGALLVDVRDSAELAQTGKAAGAVHIPRGSLEFKADPTSPDRRQELRARTRPSSCIAPPAGARRSPASCSRTIGYDKVYNLGGFKDWVESGGKVDK